MRIVVDTNVLVGAIMGAGKADGANRAVLRRCLSGVDTPLMGVALFAEMRDVLARDELFASAPVTEVERQQLLEGFCSCSNWVRPYFLWRPNLRDEGDNHVLELALNGRAQVLVSWNVRDFQRGELRLLGLSVVTPLAYLSSIQTSGE